MKTIFTILLVGVLRMTMWACNCPPPFPNLRSAKGDSIITYKTYQIDKSHISGIVKVISVEEEVQIVIDTAGCTKMYYQEIKMKNIDPKYTPLNKYLQTYSALLQMRKYEAIIIQDYKSHNIGDTIYLFSDYSNCGIFARPNEYYEIFGSEIENKKYLNIDTIKDRCQEIIIPSNSCIIDVCSANFLKSEKNINKN